MTTAVRTACLVRWRPTAVGEKHIVSWNGELVSSVHWFSGWPLRIPSCGPRAAGPRASAHYTRDGLRVRHAQHRNPCALLMRRYDPTAPGCAEHRCSSRRTDKQRCALPPLPTANDDGESSTISQKSPERKYRPDISKNRTSPTFLLVSGSAPRGARRTDELKRSHQSSGRRRTAVDGGRRPLR